MKYITFWFTDVSEDPWTAMTIVNEISYCGEGRTQEEAVKDLEDRLIEIGIEND